MNDYQLSAVPAKCHSDAQSISNDLILSLAKHLKFACGIAMQYERRDGLSDSLEIAESIIRELGGEREVPE
jgi:hypothetical protein